MQNDEPAWRGYFYTVLICLVTLTCTIFNSQCFYQEYLVGMRVKTALISAIYRYQNLKSTFFIYPEFWPFLASNYVFSQTKIDLIYVRKSFFLVQNNFVFRKISLFEDKKGQSFGWIFWSLIFSLKPTFENGLQAKSCLSGTTQMDLLIISMRSSQQWYFVTKIVLTYCEKKLF